MPDNRNTTSQRITRISLAALAGLVITVVFAIAIHTLTGTPQNRIVLIFPALLGAFAGALTGLLLDKHLRLLDKLKETVAQLQDEANHRAASEERYAALFERNHSVILLINPDTGDIVDANPSACNFYGYSLSKLKTMNICQINTMPPDMIAREMNLAKRQSRKKLYFSHRLASGEIKDVEVYAGPIRISDSVFLLSIINDISELKMLRGIIPICSKCKQIRDDQGYWKQLEAYLEQHSEADFSHGLCPHCARELYPEAFEEE